MPDYTAQATVERGTSAYIGGYFAWRGTGLSSLPDGIGLEFEVNQRNSTVAAPSNIRPLCFDASFKERFWAKNYSYTWTATNIYGVGAPSGAYADYNDTTDECQDQSLAIGVRYPKTLTSFLGEKVLDVSIYAPLGLSSSSAISGNIQAVSDDWCVSFPLMTLTDCMGVARIQNHWAGYPTGNYNQSTLNRSRAWFAPGRCWETVNGAFSELTPCS